MLTSLDEDELDEADEAEPELAAEEEPADEEPDVLLTEAGNVLVDMLLLKERAYAVHTPGDEPKK